MISIRAYPRFAPERSRRHRREGDDLHEDALRPEPVVMHPFDDVPGGELAPDVPIADAPMPAFEIE